MYHWRMYSPVIIYSELSGVKKACLSTKPNINLRSSSCAPCGAATTFGARNANSRSRFQVHNIPAMVPARWNTWWKWEDGDAAQVSLVGHRPQNCISCLKTRLPDTVPKGVWLQSYDGKSRLNRKLKVLHSLIPPSQCLSPGCNTQVFNKFLFILSKLIRISPRHFCYVCGDKITQSLVRSEIRSAISAHYRKCTLFQDVWIAYGVHIIVNILM